jgi:hypothetical protein
MPFIAVGIVKVGVIESRTEVHPETYVVVARSAELEKIKSRRSIEAPKIKKFKIHSLID